jgi:hypothetical protein
MYQRPGVGVIGPLDYYQLQPQLAAMMSMTAGMNTRELCVVSFNLVHDLNLSILGMRGQGIRIPLFR